MSLKASTPLEVPIPRRSFSLRIYPQAYQPHLHHLCVQLRVQVQLLSRVRLFATPWTAACQASLFFTKSRSLLKLMSIQWVMPSKHLLLCRPLLLPPSILPASGSFTPNVDPAEASQERNTQPPETWDKCKCHEADGWQRSRRIQGERLTVLPRLGPFTLGESKNWMSVSLLVPFTRKK